MNSLMRAVPGLLAIPAFAEDKRAHVIDMTSVLMDESGKPARDAYLKEAGAAGDKDPDPKCERRPVLTLGRAGALQRLCQRRLVIRDPPPPKWSTLSYG